EGLREHAATQSRAATAAREQADAAAAGASTLEAELITAQAAAAERRERATAELDLAVALAARAGLARRAEMLAEQLRAGTLSPETWGPLLRDLASDWRDVLHRHRELLRDSQRATAEAERARSDERDAAARVEAVLARKAACEQQLEEARAALTAAFASWRARLAELELDDDAAAAALALALAGRPAAAALTAVVERARRSAADERSTLAAVRRTAAETVAATETEIERLAAAHDDGPQPPAWTRADRAGRTGAPMWRLIDFNDGVPAEWRCGLEAALEAAGLLDAWVTPSGRLEDPALADVVLAGGRPAAGASLLEALAPVPDQAVGEAVVTELLRSVGLGEHDTGSWVDFDGRFQLGPLAGRGSKDRAEHIGAAAREARRAARIAELRDRIASLEAEIEAHDAGIAEVDRRRATLDAELDALPPVDAIASAVDAVRFASALEAEAVRAHEQASVAARMAADAEIATDAARREHAAAHGLPTPLGEAALDGLGDAAGELPGAAGAGGSGWGV